MNFSKCVFSCWEFPSFGDYPRYFFWLKLAPRPGLTGWDAKPLEGSSVTARCPHSRWLSGAARHSSWPTSGHDWIADFIYTTCQDTCPLQTRGNGAATRAMERQTGAKLVSFSVDPEKDTNRVLPLHGRRYKADSQRWLFLTGAKEEIGRLVQEGFRLSAVALSSDGKKDSVVMHSPSSS